ncbi:ATP-dependent DNA helicase RecG [Pusillimonas noertemannii]|uniref:ATP-dependent DNA helicase RecG n=1 Tax=Pusillimonas noertemannii TaxID=305977 RepID=A0A2U1CHC5_9BURK|nr:ATP-dependent DNA helicase RecG [Pusillimonas noertemannii]NYT70678.1 ATP-dependent DNA helicase RecG [Pusillimonas noertemannii]PVY60289.1 ATP-dependent DNA helicase RecG [Pusillimonas noertemannii]TFL07926.1 ATP-dependent DNA helicase RecG [Pusillimonas noertemannii]
MSSTQTRRKISKRAPAEAKEDAQSAVQRRFLRLGLERQQDFVVHLPLRYEDETRIQPIASLRPGQTGQVEGEILHSEVQFRPRRQLVAVLEDGSGRLALRWLNFYPSQQRQVERGKRVRVRGELRGGFSGVEMVHPRVTVAGGELPDSLTPVYPTTDGLAQPTLRRAIDQALREADLSDTLSEDIRRRYRLMPFDEAIRSLHHPPPSVSYQDLVEREHPAWRRVKFDELLAQQLSLAMARAARLAQRSRAYGGAGQGLVQRLQKGLPFALTAAQQRVVAEISADLARAYPMHRLLQGDVGSGKTVVAALAAAQVIANGGQVAMMAPTEILAEQHHGKLAGWLEPLGVRIAWLTGSLGVKARREAIEAIESGQAQLVVGTQALIQDKVVFANLGLVILDEQHRFGVGQRLELSRKGEEAGGALIPHQLNMSATPIPRTLAMTFFADLDVSVIDQLPPGRTPVVTKLVSDGRRDEVLALVAQEVRSGRQAYWVCPLVEESEALQLQTAVETHERLCQALPDLRVSLIHGKLKAAEKARVMDAFQAGEVDLLVATTVIEVGVDVPKASLMIIEHAERFGLAQLHQLRGRVGRGAVQSVCLLLYQAPLSQVARQRLRAMYETGDGFEIARRDLEQRGPGEFLGLRQSGAALLRFASLETDEELAAQAQELARHWLEHEPGRAQVHMHRWMRGRQDYLRS